MVSSTTIRSSARVELGFDAFISMKFAEAGKRGPITYMQKVLEEGLSYEPETYVIEDEMEHIVIRLSSYQQPMLHNMVTMPISLRKHL